MWLLVKVLLSVLVGMPSHVSALCGFASSTRAHPCCLLDLQMATVAASPMDGQVKNPWVPQCCGCGVPLTSAIQNAQVAVTLIRGYTISLYFNCSFGVRKSVCLET